MDEQNRQTVVFQRQQDLFLALVMTGSLLSDSGVLPGSCYGTFSDTLVEGRVFSAPLEMRFIVLEFWYNISNNKYINFFNWYFAKRQFGETCWDTWLHFALLCEHNGTTEMHFTFLVGVSVYVTFSKSLNSEISCTKWI